MPRCIYSGCDQTAFYGTIFNQPRFCKVHSPPGAGSVKKKCVGECSNAVFTTGGSTGGGPDLCQRCSVVNAKIFDYRRARLEELEAIIKKENLALAQPPKPQSLPQIQSQPQPYLQPQAQPQSYLPAQVPVPPARPQSQAARNPQIPGNMFSDPGSGSFTAKRSQSARQSSAESANVFAVPAPMPPPMPPSQLPLGRVRTPGPPKIVRTPEEPIKPAVNELALAKKRTQTPGRPRASSAGESKLSL